MDLLQAVALGALQGVFEWLPISSQGQVMGAAVAVLGMSVGEALKHAVFLHIGTLIAAVLYFRREVMGLLSVKDEELGKFLAIAVMASAITAVPSYIFLKQLAVSPQLLLLLIGLALLATAAVQWKGKGSGNARKSWRNGFLLGLGQGFAVIPGVSRSGITTSVLLFEGFSPEKAFKLSFLLSIPSVAVAEIAFGAAEGFTLEIVSVVAVAAAAIIGFASIKALIAVAGRINFSVFCILFGLFYVAVALI